MKDKIDIKILNLLQNEFEISLNPYKDMADKLKISEEELLQRVNNLKEKGIIRRIGAVFDSKSLGYYSTLCAVKVPDAKIDEAASLINSERGVTHNYIRDHEYNIWFTLTAPSIEKAMHILTIIEEKLGLKIVNMPSKKVYKIRVSFDLEEEDELL
ncbi:Siroheme decarboxylase AhbA, alternate heme biosynthesis pathway [Candidatus Syntrophocurvum alkaliphilum]|uniref:siroheme decarboxylase n=1 Tax=Candidatus Syntrophocurvum alkaliphilum TaxID=2293317 RepID=A0A6I6D7D6_9FIRM|nr:AsnC family transcriptional regulator [Candidatus Syntrophocurvum alkaliphilum]QGT99056.1 Siroheme decarboxylase AhbA, alternate heme biosynthesis pathway [Candidatus Syntrophocurvum alkaliphilum]